MPDKLQVTTMVLKVDLQCSKCYKKVKKVLSKFPQIQDQIYDEKQNKVTIKVVCCCPEKMRGKICCKGDGVIKSIEIKSPDDQKKKKEEPDKKEPEKKKETPQTEKKKEKAEEPEKKKETPQTEKKKEKAEESKPKNKEPAPEKGKEKDPPEKKKEPKDTPKPETDKPKVDPPAPGYPPPYYPFGMCCPECYGGHGGGPCHRYGPPPKIWYDGYYGRPVYDSWSGSSKYYGYRSDCLSEENPSACAIV